MSDFMAKFLKSSFFSSIVLTILGVLLFFKAEITIVSISYVIGGILVAIGTIALIKYLNNLNKGIKNEMDIVYGIGTIILGIIVISNPKAIASIIPFILGLVIIISSSAKLQLSIQMKNIQSKAWISTTIMSIVTLMCGIILVFNPFAGAKFITKIIGIILLVYGIIDMISTLRLKSFKSNKTNNHKENIIKEAEVIEDNTKEIKKLNNKKGKGIDD